MARKKKLTAAGTSSIRPESGGDGGGGFGDSPVVNVYKKCKDAGQGGKSAVDCSSASLHLIGVVFWPAAVVAYLIDFGEWIASFFPGVPRELKTFRMGRELASVHNDIVRSLGGVFMILAHAEKVLSSAPDLHKYFSPAIQKASRLLAAQKGVSFDRAHQAIAHAIYTHEGTAGRWRPLAQLVGMPDVDGGSGSKKKILGAADPPADSSENDASAAARRISTPSNGAARSGISLGMDNL